MYQSVLNEKIGRVRELPELPPFPVVAQQILAQISSEQVDIPRLAKNIEQDPAVLSRIIGVANSAYFGCPDKIYTVSQAITRVLGLNTVKGLALGIVLNEPFKQTTCVGFDLKNYWYDAMFTAMLCRWAGRYVSKTDKAFSDQAYLAGMLRNLGELVLAHLFSSEMSDVYRHQRADDGVDMQSLQSEVIGLSSFEASAILAQRWHLPECLQIMYRHYNDEDYQGEHRPLIDLIQLCHRLACEPDMETPYEQADMMALSTRLGLEPIQLNRLQNKAGIMRKDVEALAASLL